MPASWFLHGYCQYTAQKFILFPVHLQVSESFLGKKNLRYEPAVSLSERSRRRSEFEKTAHAFSRFFLP